MRKEIIVFSSFLYDVILCTYITIALKVSCFSDQNYAHIVSQILELFGDHVILEKWVLDEKADGKRIDQEFSSQYE